ncbi:MAG: GHMP kinase [Gammaproteobacteria bacterium]|nr:GHMP kinase [Gammaproteobacteria bacterium]
MTINIRTFPRAGLIGNPSDGFFGRTIAFTFDDFHVDLTLAESDQLELHQADVESVGFDNVEALIDAITRNGYGHHHGLLMATIKRFHQYIGMNNSISSRSSFSLKLISNIPFQLGFAGSSAIIIACLRALLVYYDVSIRPHALAKLALEVETEELGIAGGLQDRVVQVFHLVYMDFDQKLMSGRGYGEYQQLDPSCLPNLYVAYRPSLAEESGVYHHDLRQRFNEGEPAVIDAIEQWKALTLQSRDMMLKKETAGLGELMNQNFDLRASLYAIPPSSLAIINLARQVGATAKFTGSGGAVIGTYRDESMFQQLCEAFFPLGVVTFKPSVNQ